MKTKVLWVEDSARLELRNLTGPIYISGEYDMNLAEDATTAVCYLLTKEYDAIILDMRLPPGIDDYWIKIYRNKGEDKADARLGLELADWLLNGRVDFPNKPPDWIKPQLVGVFTVDDDPALQARLEYLNINVFEHKTAGLPDTILVEIIKRITTQKLQPQNGR
jgi:CheY-like chemotaxis protein